MYTEPVIIIGTGRSGTSLLTAMLFQLDVFVGDKLVPADRNNPIGHYEDSSFNELDQEFINKKISEDDFMERAKVLVNRRATMFKQWGWKSPYTANNLSLYMRLLDKPKIIWCKRPEEEVIKSCKRAYGWDEKKTKEMFEQRTKGIKAVKEKMLIVEHKNLLENPKEELLKVIKWIGITPSQEEINRAVSLVVKPFKDKKKVLIAVPNMGWIRKEVLHSLIPMMGDSRYLRKIITPTAVPYEKNINKIVYEEFLPGGYDYLVLMDADNPSLKNPLDLIQLDRDILALPTITRKQNIILFNICDMVQKRYKPLPIKRQIGLQEVDAAGSGCMIISRRVLEAIKNPFRMRWNEDGTEARSGDFGLCSRAKKKGFKVWAHFDYICGHIKEVNLLDLK